MFNSFSPYVANRKNPGYNNILKQLRLLVEHNYNPEILRRKNMRLRFRALRDSLVNWPIEREHSKKVSKTVMVTKTKTDVFGTKTSYQEPQEETRTVNVMFSFKNATFVIAKGFQIQLHYNDGYGENPMAADGWTPTSWSNEFHNVMSFLFIYDYHFSCFMCFINCNCLVYFDVMFFF